MLYLGYFKLLILKYNCYAFTMHSFKLMVILLLKCINRVLDLNSFTI